MKTIFYKNYLKFNFENKCLKKILQCYNKAPNKGLSKKYKYKIGLKRKK